MKPNFHTKLRFTIAGFSRSSAAPPRAALVGDVLFGAQLQRGSGFCRGLTGTTNTIPEISGISGYKVVLLGLCAKIALRVSRSSPVGRPSAGALYYCAGIQAWNDDGSGFERFVV